MWLGLEGGVLRTWGAGCASAGSGVPRRLLSTKGCLSNLAATDLRPSPQPVPAWLQRPARTAGAPACLQPPGRQLTPRRVQVHGEPLAETHDAMAAVPVCRWALATPILARPYYPSAWPSALSSGLKHAMLQCPCLHLLDTLGCSMGSAPEVRQAHCSTSDWCTLPRQTVAMLIWWAAPELARLCSAQRSSSPHAPVCCLGSDVPACEEASTISRRPIHPGQCPAVPCRPLKW